MKLVITDNACVNGHEGWPLEQCFKDHAQFIQKRSQIVHDLGIIGGKSLSDIINENPDILIFPHSLGAHNDDINGLQICSYNPNNSRIYTGNLMGFIGINDTQLTIRSRFAANDADHFLHYMLVKVFCPNILKFRHDINTESVFDFLIYLFPHFFNDAMRQGLFKKYRRFQRNDLNVKGTIDISRHIRSNQPFNGKIAYNTHEHSYDNHITQLIRHTIEFIKRSPIGWSILQERNTQTNIRIIADATSDYYHSNLRKILHDNRQVLNHPYFTKYIPLQKLCISILKRHKLKYGSDNNKVYGILFDGAWLWEEFLNTIFKGWGMIHAENKTYKNPIYLFGNDSYPRYPDFYRQNETVIDAKYKRLGDKDIARDDIHQIITYLHVLNARSAFVAYPKEYGNSLINYIGTLKGMQGKIGRIALKIPQSATSFCHFHDLMEDEINTINQLWSIKDTSTESHKT